MGGVPPRQVRLLLACLLISGCGQAEEQNTRANAERIAPLSAVSCDRNLLTSYFGVVSDYRRDANETWLKISTDYDTVEEVSIDHPGQQNAITQFRLWGEPFGESDWAIIETAPGKIIPGMRVTAWVCDDGRTPALIDWQPPNSQPKS